MVYIFESNCKYMIMERCERMLLSLKSQTSVSDPHFLVIGMKMEGIFRSQYCSRVALGTLIKELLLIVRYYSHVY